MGSSSGLKRVCRRSYICARDWGQAELRFYWLLLRLAQRVQGKLRAENHQNCLTVYRLDGVDRVGDVRLCDMGIYSLISRRRYLRNSHLYGTTADAEDASSCRSRP